MLLRLAKKLQGKSWIAPRYIAVSTRSKRTPLGLRCRRFSLKEKPLNLTLNAMQFYSLQLQKHTVEPANDWANISVRLTTCAENICPSSEGIHAIHLLAANEVLSECCKVTQRSLLLLFICWYDTKGTNYRFFFYRILFCSACGISEDPLITKLTIHFKKLKQCLNSVLGLFRGVIFFLIV